jgi:hypothetical protein
VDAICFPTYAARHQIAVLGPDAFPPAYPRPEGAFTGLSVLDENGSLVPSVLRILALIARHDAALFTGHLSAAESLALLRCAQELGVRRMLVTHASWLVPDMSVDDQLAAVSCGALIEHCLMGTMPGQAHTVPIDRIREQIRQVGHDHVIISSDLGQVANGPVVEGFARCLAALQQAGVAPDEIRTMIHDNPQKLLSKD